MKQILAAAFLLAMIASAVPLRAEPVPFDLQRSKLTVYVYKQGVFSLFADNHVVDAPLASGTFDSVLKSVAFSVNAAQLQVLDPKLPASRRANGSRKTAFGRSVSRARKTAAHRAVSEMSRNNGSARLTGFPLRDRCRLDGGA